MSIVINSLNINNPAQALISSELNRSYGRRFEVKQGMGEDSTITTMNALYKSACIAVKENKEDKVALAKLKVFVATLSQAEIAANLHYADAGCLYKFRTFFHRFFGGAFFGTHSDRLAKLSLKIDAHIRGPAGSPIGKWNHANQFTPKVYEPLPVPKTFEGSIISNSAFESLIREHKVILDSSGETTHGKAIDNLRDAFLLGQGRTIGGPKSDFVPDKAKNNIIHKKVQEVLSIISQQDPEKQKESMYKLSIAFAACNTGRINVIEEMHDSLLFNSSTPDFEGRVKLKIFSHRQELFNRLIREKSNANGPSHMQFPHMSSGYLAEVGDALGLSGTLNAGTDPHKYQVSSLEKNLFINEFKMRFAQGLNELLDDLAGEINEADGPFHPTGQQPSFGTWIVAKVNTGELEQTFAYHDEDKQYPGLKEPTDNQKFNIKFYISRVEVKHILGMLGYLQ